MASITLISNPIIAELRDVEAVQRLMTKRAVYSAPQLGLLTVAGLFKDVGWDVSVINANKEYLSHLSKGGSADSFCDAFAQELANYDSQYYGFSSICSSYYITLTLVRALKRICPQARIILGGPQATSTAQETIKLYPEIDYIMRGEVDSVIPAFVAHHLTNPQQVPGLSYRCEGRALANEAAKVPKISEMARPAYDFWDMSAVESIPIEGGRGCPFICKFCSTSTFFGRAYRIKPPKLLLSEVLDVVGKYGVKQVSFVHDNLFLTKKACQEFCLAWKEQEQLSDVYWTCSLRAGLIDDQTADLLKEANCEGIFIGVESGSKKMQALIKKNLNLDIALATIRLLSKKNIHSTAAYIIGFPEETIDDLRCTVNLYELSLRTPFCKSQVSSLAVLPGAGYGLDDLNHDAQVSTISHQGPSIDSTYFDIIHRSPSLFSAHFKPKLMHLNSDIVSETEYFLNYSYGVFRWLVVFLSRCIDGGLFSLANRWIACRRRSPDAKLPLYNYYTGRAFQKEFVAFAEEMAKSDAFDEKFADVFAFLRNAYGMEEKYNAVRYSKPRGNSTNRRVASGDEEVVSACLTADVDYSFNEVVSALSSQNWGEVIHKRKSVISLYEKDGDILIEEAAPLARHILSFVRGRTKVQTLVRTLSKNDDDLLPNYLAHKRADAYRYCIDSLIGQGMLRKAS